MKPFLIVNADDFGLSPGVNRGVIFAHENGIVTSASLMVRWPAAGEAARYARERRSLSVGLHLDLGEWIYRGGQWVPLNHVARLDDPAEVREQVSRQLSAFRELMGQDPTHLDSHQHVHLREPVRSILVETARALRVPLRKCGTEVRHCGRFYGQTAEGDPYPEGIAVSALIGILRELPPGFTELGCHPGMGQDNLDTMYVDEREEEVKTLCDPLVRTALAELGVTLCSFAGIRRTIEHCEELA